MIKGTIIYLFDHDLSKLTERIKNLSIDDVDSYSFYADALSKEEFNKASMVIYVSERFKQKKVLKNIY